MNFVESPEKDALISSLDMSLTVCELSTSLSQRMKPRMGTLAAPDPALPEAGPALGAFSKEIQ